MGNLPIPTLLLKSDVGQVQWQMLHFGQWKGLRQSISDHIGSKAIDETDLSVFHDPAYEVEMDVDVLGMCVILMVFSECDG